MEEQPTTHTCEQCGTTDTWQWQAKRCSECRNLSRAAVLHESARVMGFDRVVTLHVEPATGGLAERPARASASNGRVSISSEAWLEYDALGKLFDELRGLMPLVICDPPNSLGGCGVAPPEPEPFTSIPDVPGHYWMYAERARGAVIRGARMVRLERDYTGQLRDVSWPPGKGYAASLTTLYGARWDGPLVPPPLPGSA